MSDRFDDAWDRPVDESKQLDLWPVRNPEQDRILPIGSDALTLEEARAQLYVGMDDGTSCPCCGQDVKVYRRTLNGPMCFLLIWLVLEHLTAPRWRNVREFPQIQNRRGGGDFAKLRYWGLIQPRDKDEDDPKRRTSGDWRPTGRGISFVHGKITVPRAVYIYDTRLLRFDPVHTTIHQALGKEWDYHELMGFSVREEGR